MSALFVARSLRQLGHEPRIILAKYTRPFAKEQKNDDSDAEAIAEAAQAVYETPSHTQQDD